MASLITHLFFDVGGVLGTSGWDISRRQLGAAHLGIDAAQFEVRHQQIVERFECGGATLAQYTRSVLPEGSPSDMRDRLEAFMFAQSSPFPDVIAVARALRDTGKYKLMTINNESVELNVYRLHHFGLIDLFSAFFSSCWVHAAKPSPRIYERALDISQARPQCSIFIDDRAENLPPAAALGMHTILFRSADQLIAELAQSGVDVVRRLPR